MRPAATAALLLAAGAAVAHPHGRLACGVTLTVHGGQLVAVEQRLTLDAASSAALAERVAPEASAPLPRPVWQFRELLLGLFRQSAWMLELRPDGGEPVVLDDDGAQWQQQPDGRLQLTLRLRPTAAVAWAGDGQLQCRDPSWYWVGEFADAQAVQVQGAHCEARFDAPRDAAREAASLQAAALAAGVAGAERVARAVTEGPALGAGQARLRCDQTVRPPSTGNSTPVMNSASSLAR